MSGEKYRAGVITQKVINILQANMDRPLSWEEKDYLYERVAIIIRAALIDVSLSQEQKDDICEQAKIIIHEALED